jgi:DNA recombination protein RmuC
MEILVIILLFIILVVLLILFLRKPSGTSTHLLALKEQEHQKTISWLKEEKAKTEDELNDLRSLFFEERSKLYKAEENLRSILEKQSEQAAYITELQLKSRTNSTWTISLIP